MESAYATAAIDPKTSNAGSQRWAPTATALRNSHREGSDAKDPGRIPVTSPIGCSILEVVISNLWVPFRSSAQDLRRRKPLSWSRPDDFLKPARRRYEQWQHHRNCHNSSDHMEGSTIFTSRLPH